MKLSLLLMATLALGAILGVDYGQQFSKAVLLAPGVSYEIVLTDEGKRKDLLGILVRAVADDIERVYGLQIGSLCTRFPQSCLTGIKPLLGRAFDDKATQEYLQHHFGIRLLEDSLRNSVKFDLGFANQSYQFSPEEVVAMNLNEIKHRALAMLESNPHAQPVVEDIAVSIPPFASQLARQAYLDAIQLANFSNPLGLVEEGTAVALNFLSNKKFDKADFDKKSYHLVYDVGAGSTTATLFSYTPSITGSVTLDVENVGYDESFGGALLTKSIFDILYDKFLVQFGLSERVEISPKLLARLLDASEKAKTVLSANTEYQVSLESFYNEKDFRASITRDEFEEINGDLMARITKPILDALDSPSGKLTIGDIESVILNGGSSRVPFIQKHLVSLIGDDKIAKTVNADESCALGTTHKAFKLKLQLEKKNDIKLVERSFHNYEVAVGDEPEVVFARGDVVGNTTTKKLGELQDVISFSLYEDGALLKSYTVDGLLKRAEKLSCKSTDSKDVVATFGLDHNKIFDLVGLNLECTKKSEGFLDKLLKKDTEEPVNATATNTTKTARPARPVAVTLPKATYPHVKPISRVTKDRLFDKLAYLNSQDERRAHLDHVKNVLESKCYEVRAYIDDHEEALLEEVSASAISEFTSFVGATIEWLEFESDDATLEEFEAKVEEVAGVQRTVQRYLDIKNTDLSLESFQALYEEGTKQAMQIQTNMLEFGSEISEIRQKYDEHGFAFDKENDRIKIQLMARGDDAKMLSLDQNLAAYKQDLTDIGDITANPKTFGKLLKEALYEKYTQLEEKISQMAADVAAINDSHQHRMTLFNTKFDKLLQRKLQKELSEKLKKEAAEPEEEAEAEVEGFIEEDDIIEEATQAESSTTLPVQDEL